MGWSFDVAIRDVTTGPKTAYIDARGAKVIHPAGYEVQLKIQFIQISFPFVQFLSGHRVFLFILNS